MAGHRAEADVAANLLERRWFASMAAARAKQEECAALLEVMAMARVSWRDSRLELRKLEALRDALAEELAEEAAERRVLREQFAIEESPADRMCSAA